MTDVTGKSFSCQIEIIRKNNNKRAESAYQSPALRAYK